MVHDSSPVPPFQKNPQNTLSLESIAKPLIDYCRLMLFRLALFEGYSPPRSAITDDTRR